MNQNFYTIQIDSISACFNVKINDIPLYADDEGKPTSAEFPINHLLVNGLNILQVTISHAKHESGFVDHTKTDFQIYCRDINDDRENRQLITSVEFPDYHNDENLKQAVIPSRKEFKAVLPLDTPLWSTSSVLKLNEPTVNQIMDIYREFHKALKTKNTDTVFRLTGIKNKVYADSVYKSLNTHLNTLREAFAETFDDPANELIDFDIQLKKPQLHAFGKLVTLMNDEDRSPLQYYNAESGVTTSYQVYLCMKDQKLAIVL